jgi:hypothetical protein
MISEARTAAILFIIALYARVVFAEGEIQNLKQYQYWDNKKVRQCDIYDTAGYLKRKVFCRDDGTIERVEKYDSYGNKIEAALYDGNGKLKLGIDGWAAMRWWYDGSRLVSRISYNDTGRPIERMQYSESGKLILRQYADDEKLDPYEEASMYMLLGPRNVPYYDPYADMEENVEIINK